MGKSHQLDGLSLSSLTVKGNDVMNSIFGSGMAGIALTVGLTQLDTLFFHSLTAYDINKG